MSASNRVPGFVPSTSGCHFQNSFSGPDLVVNLPLFGAVDIGDAANGVCGGMVFTARDFFEHDLPMVADTVPPASGSPLFQYVVGRLFDSFNIPAGVLQYFDWMNTPDHDTGIWIAIRRGVAWRTIVNQWPTVRSTIDSGHPCPLGLVTVQSLSPADLGQNHVVCAYGYDLSDRGDLVIHVYDPNSPNNNNVQMSVNINNPAHTTPIAHNINISHPVRGFFVATYSVHDPSALEPPPPPAAPSAILAVTVAPASLPGGVPASVTVDARDAHTGTPASGEVLINNAVVGHLGTPFTYTFRPLGVAPLAGPHPRPISWPTGRISVPGYPQTLVRFPLPQTAEV